MNMVNHAMPQGMGIGQLDRLSPNTTDSLSSRFGADISPRHPHHAPADDVRLSHHARSFNISRPGNLPPPGSPGGDSDLATSLRKVGQFLKEHPRIAESPFGKAVQTLMRGGMHLVKTGSTGDMDGIPPEAKETLLGAVRQAKEFLENHPRVADSPLGTAVVEMARAVVSTIGAEGGDPGLTLKDEIILAAKQAHQFLEAYPKIAEMPLGQAVEKLIDGVQESDEGITVDPDIQNLAKRIGHFVGSHPRLAESEFGQLISTLTRGILALDTTVPPDEEPPVDDDSLPDVAVPVASNDRPAMEMIKKADLQQAA
ncbi:MAG: hypothetical protein O3C34_10210 [Proteobacteria bacterium]|nr:hypothetical protein [Pseudomonadota bacterium]